jgi:hypothetical protein
MKKFFIKNKEILKKSYKTNKILFQITKEDETKKNEIKERVKKIKKLLKDENIIEAQYNYIKLKSGKNKT